MEEVGGTMHAAWLSHMLLGLRTKTRAGADLQAQQSRLVIDSFVTPRNGGSPARF